MQNEEIAIVGVSVRLPGNVESPSGFMDMLKAEKDCISQSQRWHSSWIDKDMILKGEQKIYCERAGFIDDIDGFDPSIFKISKGEAPNVDPQQRMLLEGTWQALQDSGYCVDKVKGTKTGVYVALMNHDYQTIQTLNVVNEFTPTGSAPCM